VEIVQVGGVPASRPLSEYTINGASFPNKEIYNEAKHLISYHCPYSCGDYSDDFHFKSLSDLQTHLKRDHDHSVFCEICLNHRQCFVPEQTVYTTTTLAEHAKSEHASCEFCRGEKFYSIDELLYHMNQVHFKCIVCDRLDYRNEYYGNYDALNNHSNEAHFPCEYPECREQRFVVFPDEEDLQLHWLEKHGRGRSLAIGGSIGGIAGSTFGGKKRMKNRYPQTAYNTHVRFRGPRNVMMSTAASAAVAVVHEYPDDLNGRAYNPRVHHANNRPPRPTVVADISSKLAKYRDLVIDCHSSQYKNENIAFLKKLESSISADAIRKLKSVSVDFKNGRIGIDAMIDYLISLGDVDVAVELVRLMPDPQRRDELVRGFHARLPSIKQAARVKPAPLVVKKAPQSGPEIDMPENLYDVEKKPSLIHALFAILESIRSTGQGVIRPVASKELPQAILSAMENKVNSIDRIQLTTLSEMRNHLLLLADSGPSWSAADDVVSLRPLLYRLLQVPETHRSREGELVRNGWREFSSFARNVLDTKFTKLELSWIRAYLTFCLLRSTTIGPLETRRGEFPTLPMSAYLPSAVSTVTPSVVASAAPTRADFPNILQARHATPPAQSSSNRQWNNHISGLRDEAFPELGPPLIVEEPTETGPDFSRPWSCPRCTYTNTIMLSMQCEICGMERPPPGDDQNSVNTVTDSVIGTTARPKRTKQKIVLSSATQRDYKR